jgi:hypothetical protein
LSSTCDLLRIPQVDHNYRYPKLAIKNPTEAGVIRDITTFLYCKKSLISWRKIMIYSSQPVFLIR